jgi:hypothetical protein
LTRDSQTPIPLSSFEFQVSLFQYSRFIFPSYNIFFNEMNILQAFAMMWLVTINIEMFIKLGALSNDSSRVNARWIVGVSNNDYECSTMCVSLAICHPNNKDDI